ncbi:MAG: hypothetical protein PHD24_00870 [Candidatus Izemoplasmatales bacterium]|nr:hypothetical protein [Candidatus Izemoplasmatales bacterium]
MKRVIIALSLSMLMVFVLMACDVTTAPTTATPTTPVAVEFAVDGEFTAFEAGVHVSRGVYTPEVTMVTVTIENGEIVGFNIDARQGTSTQSTTLTDPDTPANPDDDYYAYTFAWNAKTKKELGFEYHMFYSTYSATTDTPTHEGYVAWMGLAETTQLEWHEQAALIEAYWLANGVDAVQTNLDGDFTNVAGATISESGYNELAQEAIALARQGKFQTVVCSGSDLYIASMLVNELGVVEELVLDTLQKASSSAVDGIFTWNAYTKQQLGDNYGMVGASAQVFADGAWTESDTLETTLEWYEQVNLITNYVLEHGYNSAMVAIGGRGVSLDGTTLLDACAGVTIHSSTYLTLLAQLYACPAEGALTE